MRFEFVKGARTIDEAALDLDPVFPPKDRDETRSGVAARLAYQTIVNHGTFTDFCNAVDADSSWRHGAMITSASMATIGRYRARGS